MECFNPSSKLFFSSYAVVEIRYFGRLLRSAVLCGPSWSAIMYFVLYLASLLVPHNVSYWIISPIPKDIFFYIRSQNRRNFAALWAFVSPDLVPLVVVRCHFLRKVWIVLIFLCPHFYFYFFAQKNGWIETSSCVRMKNSWHIVFTLNR